MKDLIINVKAKDFMTLLPTTVKFVREVNVTKEIIVSYEGGTDQQLNANAVLYTQGTEGSLDYIKVINKDNFTANGNGSFPILVSTYPNAFQINKTINIDIFSSANPLALSFIYNSIPVTNNVILEAENRVPRVILAEDILVGVTDFDGDSITDVMLYGNVSGFLFNGNPYVAGTPISVAELNNELLTTIPLDQNDAYTMTCQYKVKDSAGNISN